MIGFQPAFVKYILPNQMLHLHGLQVVQSFNIVVGAVDPAPQRQMIS